MSSDGRRRLFLRNRKSAKKWENRTNEELREIYWQLRTQYNHKPQFIAFCDFLRRNNKLEEVIK